MTAKIAVALLVIVVAALTYPGALLVSLAVIATPAPPAPAGTPGALSWLHVAHPANARPFIADDHITEAQMDMTLNVMAHSLVYWTQDIVLRGLMKKGGRIFSMTCPELGQSVAECGKSDSHITWSNPISWRLRTP